MKYILILFLLASCQTVHNVSTNQVQDYQLVNERWERVGMPYDRPDNLTVAHAYHWKGKQIDMVQDYHKINGQWVKYGEPYSCPDTLVYIHTPSKL
jgi:hypothetical protein